MLREGLFSMGMGGAARGCFPRHGRTRKKPQDGHGVGGRALRLLAGGVERVVGEWWGRTEKTVAGSEEVRRGRVRGKECSYCILFACREDLRVSYEEDKRLPPS